jgi:hypothetical protein
MANPNADRLGRRIKERIARSETTLTVRYGPARTVPAGSGPMARPASPLTGVAPAPLVITPVATPAKSDVTMPCLFQSTFDERDLDRSRDRNRGGTPGWVREADALVRVRFEDAVVNAAKPEGDTVFTDCEVVIVRGKRYRVLQIDPMGAGFSTPHSFSVWLVGAAKQ